MNNWRDIKEEAPRVDTSMIRVKYIYCTVSVPQWATPFDILFNQTMSRKPFATIISHHLGIGVVHIDPPRFDDNGIDLLSGGFRWSDLKGDNQRITHWMYLDDPYDESEETPDVVLLQDQDGNIKEPASVTVQEFDKPNKMGRVYNAKNIASVISKDPRFKKENNNMKFVKQVTQNVFVLSKFVIGAAYLCTPHNTSKNGFVGIYKEGGPTTISFWVPSGINTLEVDDVVNGWDIERMIDPFSEEELNFIYNLIVHHSLNNGSESKDIADSILKKLGLSVKVEFTKE